MAFLKKNLKRIFQTDFGRSLESTMIMKLGSIRSTCLSAWCRSRISTICPLTNKTSSSGLLFFTTSQSEAFQNLEAVITCTLSIQRQPCCKYSMRWVSWPLEATPRIRTCKLFCHWFLTPRNPSRRSRPKLCPLTKCAKPCTATSTFSKSLQSCGQVL